ncbi:hypothetical protein HanRHA438_Chr02g0056781 [Helianthus annuus]|nr:hypothetical protein HanIR_Chr09g0432741 [Helianthus annuus]KAJ0889498.1 hypothetical protein HanRHA438_Chr09g0413501 [Helianthus annuus]KAJ0939057.1 hypothetical protein HanRHA438_Chr02g0056781 [Helianthus annuus]
MHASDGIVMVTVVRVRYSCEEEPQRRRRRQPWPHQRRLWAVVNRVGGGSVGH